MRILRSAVLGALSASLLCCTSPEVEAGLFPTKEQLSVTSLITVAGDGALTGRLEINATSEWTVTGNPDWITLDRYAGTGNATVEVMCQTNPSSEEERTAVLTVSSLDKRIRPQVTVTQSAATETVGVNNEEIELPGEGGSKTLTITDCNTKWSVSGVESWLTLSQSEGEGNADITVTAARNESGTPHDTHLVIQGRSASAIVHVTQPVFQESITTQVESLDFTSEGGSKTLAVQSNTSWTVSGLESWLTLSLSAGEGNADIAVTAARNESNDRRNATIVIQGKRASRSVSISQAPHESSFDISPSGGLSVPASASTSTLAVIGDAEWTATVDRDWCRLGKYSGKGADELSVEVSSNAGQEQRVATITFKAIGRETRYTVTQAGGNAPRFTAAVTYSGVEKHQFTVTATYESEHAVTERGFCYSLTTPEPSQTDGMVKASGTDATFSATIASLQSGKTYYVRAYAISQSGIGYSAAIKVTTSGSRPGKDDNGSPGM